MKRNLQPTRSTGLMTWLATHILSARLVYLLAVLVALGEPVRAAVATAAPVHDESPSTASSDTQQLDPNLIQVCSYNEEKCEPWAPPPLLNLDQQVFFASSAQKASLRALEKQAVANVIKDHGLTDADSIAVQTWGRNVAQAELYLLLTEAILRDNRTTDQQNAVDWLSGIMRQKAIASAENAGREYVRWAGLNMSAYETLLRGSPTETQLREFLNDNPQLQAFCAYVPPTPFTSDYTASTHPICQSQGLSCQGANFGLDCNPPTPSYDQFVKYGQAVASYEFLKSAQFSRAGSNNAKAVLLGLSTGAAVAAGSFGTAAAVTMASTVTGLGGEAALSALFPFSGLSGVGLLLGPLIIIIVAIAIAVTVGISVINASELPGQLAELITDARTTAQDAKDLTDTTNGATTFLTIFVGATLPEPDFRACDNANPGLPPGVTVIAGIFTYVGAPCLNPSAIPPPVPTDLQFLVQEQGGTAVTQTPTIGYRDAETGAATTARLSKTWFVTTANGTTTQRLSIVYSDWQNKTKYAWLIPNASTGGYTFVTVIPSDAIDIETCEDEGKCDASDSLEYLGSDGKNYSAKVRGPAVPTGEAKFSPIKPAEGSPQSFSANGFSFTDAVGPLTYQWRFQNGGCNFGTGGCMGPDPNGTLQLVPSYGNPVSGESITHSWTLAGTFLVELTAIDSRGIKGSKAFPVTVENVPPTLLVYGECILDPAGIPFTFCNPRTKNLGESATMSGGFADVGTGTYNRLTINWGDGTVDSQCISPPDLGVCFHVIVVGQPDPLQLGRIDGGYTFDGSHTYASRGSYYGAVTVNDPMGGSKSEPFVVTIKGLAQSINFSAMAAHTFGDAAFGISATGGDSGQPVTFTVTGSQAVCALSGANGGGSVSLLQAGTCTITANQSGSGNYDPAAAVTQSFTINRAPLTITASSNTITYGAAVPPITPSYSAFAGSESAASLDTQPTCSAAPSGGAAGSYATSCTGAVDPNYNVNYVGGTLKIEKAGTTLALIAAPATAVKGQPVAFTATVGITSAGATNPGGTVDFKDGTATIAGCAGLPVNTATNSATCTTSALTVGSHSVTAAYSGDTNFNGSSTVAAAASTVNRAATATTVSAPGTSIKGQSATFTADVAVTAPGAGSPAGTVTFIDGTTSLGTGQLSVVTGKVQGTFSTSGLALGRHAITARYAGNGDFTTSTSAPVIHYVNTDISGIPTLPGGVYDLTNANLMNAFLVGVSLTGARILSANLMGATLINAVLTGADVSGSNLRNANFTGADLTGVRFSNSNLMGATGLATATLTNVVWINTVCPNGRNSDRNGGTCVGQW